MQGAKFFATKSVAVFVDVAENVVKTATTNNIFRGPTGYAFGGFAPIGDSSVPITDVHAVAEGVQNDVGEGQQVFHRWLLRGIIFEIGHRLWSPELTDNTSHPPG